MIAKLRTPIHSLTYESTEYLDPRESIGPVASELSPFSPEFFNNCYLETILSNIWFEEMYCGHASIRAEPVITT